MIKDNGEKKKLGFRDKLKKMFDGDSEKKNSEVDTIKFTLSGGPVHSQLLVAEALGQNSGMPLPVVCKWFNRTRADEVSEIEGVTGAYYQPCADDVDTLQFYAPAHSSSFLNISIFVEARPQLEEKSSKGEVFKKEVGPLVLDKSIQVEVQQLLEVGICIFSIKLEEIITNGLESKTEQFPMACNLVIDTERAAVEVPTNRQFNASCELGEKYPHIKIIKRTNSSFELYLGSSLIYRLQAQSNIHRDLIVVSLKMFCGRKVVEKSMQSIKTIKEDHPNDNRLAQKKKYHETGDSHEVKLDTQIDCIKDGKQESIKEDTITPIRESRAIATITTKIDSSAKGGEQGCCQHCIYKNENNSPELKLRLKQQQQQQQQESYEIFVKLNELIKKSVELESIRDEQKSKILQLENLMKDKENEAAKLLRDKDNEAANLLKDKSNEILQLQYQLKQLTIKYQQMVESNQLLTHKHEQYMDEKLFLTQESQVMQAEIKTKDQECENIRSQNQELKKILEETRHGTHTQELERVAQDLSDKLNKIERQNNEYEQLTSDQEQKLNEQTILNEQLLNKVNYLQKKCEVLIQEKAKNEEQREGKHQSDSSFHNNSASHNSQFKPIQDIVEEVQQQSKNYQGEQDHNSRESWPTSHSPHPELPNMLKSNSQQKAFVINFQKTPTTEGIPPLSSPNQILPQLVDSSCQLLKNELQSKIEEVSILSKRVQQLESTLNVVSQAYTQDVKAINSSVNKWKGKQGGGNDQALQKIINSLTELLTEKDLALQKQNKTIKELQDQQQKNQHPTG